MCSVNNPHDHDFKRQSSKIKHFVCSLRRVRLYPFQAVGVRFRNQAGLSHMPDLHPNHAEQVE